MGKVLDTFNRYVEALLEREPYGTSADEVREAIRGLEAERDTLQRDVTEWAELCRTCHEPGDECYEFVADNSPESESD